MAIKTVGIVGAGTMGNGIAQACAVAGLDVVMVDISDAAVQKGIATVAGSLDRLIKKEKLTAEGKAQALSLITTSTAYGVSAEHGKVISLVGSLLAPWLGTFVLDENDESQPITQLQLTAEYTRYLVNPWIPNHVFMGRAATGLTVGDTQYLGNYQLGGNFSESAFYIAPQAYRRLRGFPFGYRPADAASSAGN